MRAKKLKFSVALAIMLLVSTPSHAVLDPVNTLLHLMRSIESAMEVAFNQSTKKKMDELNKLVGEASKILPVFAQKEDFIDHKEFAPIVTTDLQKIVDDGFEAIPDIRAYAEENFRVLSSSDVDKQAEVLVQINERLSLSVMDALQKAKNIAAVTNNVDENTQKQLDLSGKTKDVQHKVVQEAAQDISMLKKDVAINQELAHLLSVTAAELLASRQNSTADIDEDGEYDLFGRGGDGTKPLKYDAQTGFPKSWGKVKVVPCGTFKNRDTVANQQRKGEEARSNLAEELESSAKTAKNNMDNAVSKMPKTQTDSSKTDVSKIVADTQQTYTNVVTNAKTAMTNAEQSAESSLGILVSDIEQQLKDLAKAMVGGKEGVRNTADQIVQNALQTTNDIYEAGINAIDYVSSYTANTLDDVANNSISAVTGGETAKVFDLPETVRNNLNDMYSDSSSAVDDMKGTAKSNLTQQTEAAIAAINKALSDLVAKLK